MDIETAKDEAFSQLLEILVSLGGEEMDPIERVKHVLDLLEEVTARIISNCGVTGEAIEELCDVFGQNLRFLAKRFLEEEKGS